MSNKVKKFRVNHNELWVRSYEVVASSEEEAMVKFREGEAVEVGHEMMEGGLDTHVEEVGS